VVADGAHDADADVIAAGREPGSRPRWPGRLIWLLAIAEAVVLAVAVVIALHYRAEASGLRPAGPPTAGPAGPTGLLMPEMTSVTLPLPAGGRVVGTVVITAAALPGAGLAQFTVSAVITGAAPDTFYDLIGNDCSTVSPLGNYVWATGFTGANGTADLVGYSWTGAVTDEYWLTLDPSSLSLPPGLHGQFAEGRAAPFPAGQAPCAPSS
jgi:hypothetical protein